MHQPVLWPRVHTHAKEINSQLKLRGLHIELAKPLPAEKRIRRLGSDASLRLPLVWSWFMYDILRGIQQRENGEINESQLKKDVSILPPLRLYDRFFKGLPMWNYGRIKGKTLKHLSWRSR